MITINIESDNDYLKICEDIPGIQTKHQYGCWNYYLDETLILHANIFADDGEGVIIFYLKREEIIKIHQERWRIENNKPADRFEQIEL